MEIEGLFVCTHLRVNVAMLDIYARSHTRLRSSTSNEAIFTGKSVYTRKGVKQLHKLID